MPGFKLYEVPGYDEPLELSEEHAEALGGTEIGSTGERPARSASKAEWTQYAIRQGMDPSSANAATKADLVATYG